MMPKAIYLIAISLLFFSCRKDEKPPVIDYWDYSGGYLLSVNSASNQPGTIGNNTTVNRDLLYQVTQEGNTLSFYGVDFPITSEGQLEFTQTTSGSNSETKTLNFSEDLNSITFKSFNTNGNEQIENFSYSGFKSSLTPSNSTGVHPRKNEIDGNYLLTYSETEYEGGAIVFDTSYTDTTTVSIELVNDYYELHLDTTIFSIPEFVTTYKSSWTYSFYSTLHKKYFLDNDSLFINHYTSTDIPEPHTDWSYSGVKL